MKPAPKKPGPKPGSGKGRKAVTVAVSLLPDKLAVVDANRGSLTRAGYLRGLVPTEEIL